MVFLQPVDHRGGRGDLLPEAREEEGVLDEVVLLELEHEPLGPAGEGLAPSARSGSVRVDTAWR